MRKMVLLFILGFAVFVGVAVISSASRRPRPVHLRLVEDGRTFLDEDDVRLYYQKHDLLYYHRWDDHPSRVTGVYAPGSRITVITGPVGH
jgi:hypothetical protein